jgi:hypothetical protein
VKLYLGGNRDNLAPEGDTEKAKDLSVLLVGSSHNKAKCAAYRHFEFMSPDTKRFAVAGVQGQYESIRWYDTSVALPFETKFAYWNARVRGALKVVRP